MTGRAAHVLVAGRLPTTSQCQLQLKCWPDARSIIKYEKSIINVLDNLSVTLSLTTGVAAAIVSRRAILTPTSPPLRQYTAYVSAVTSDLFVNSLLTASQLTATELTATGITASQLTLHTYLQEEVHRQLPTNFN